MNRTRLLMIGAVALFLGAFVSLFVYKNLQGRGSSSNEPGNDVIVAADDIQVGARIEEHDVRTVKYPASALPAGTYSARSKVMGRGVILPIAKGEFILPSKLAPENAGSGLPSLIPPGMRAVSVRVNEVVSVAGFVGPGTRVDILLTGTPNGSSEPQTTTVLQNVAVIAAGQHLERNAAGDAQNAPVITSGFSRGRRTRDPGSVGRQDSTRPAQSAQQRIRTPWTLPLSSTDSVGILL